MSQFHTSEFAGLEEKTMAAYESCRRRWERDGTAPPRGEDPMERAIADSWSRSGVPAAFRDVPPALRDSGWAYIHGPVGSGKTWGACRMLRRFIEQTSHEVAPGIFTRPNAHFATAQEYLEVFKSGYDGSSMDRALTLRNCEYLVVDDLGQEVPTQWAVSKLFDLVNHRWSEGKPTVFTSQLPPDAIESRLAVKGGEEQAAAISSRILGSCAVFGLGGADRRIA